MLKTIYKSGMASLRYTMLTVIGAAILGVGTTEAEYIADIGFNYNTPRTITNQQTNNGGEYTYTTDNIGNFKTTKDNIEHNFRYFTRYGNPNSFMVMGWKNGQIYVFLTQTNSSNTATIQNQGYVSGFAILPSDYEFNTGGNIKNNIPLTTDRNTIKIILGKHNIIGFHANNKNDTANGGNTASQYYGNFMFFANNYVSNYCLITDDEIEHYICFRNSTRATNSSFYENNLTGSENKTTTSRKDITQFDTFYNEESPIIQGGTDTRTGSPCITIGQLINMGGNEYNTGMCYTDSKYWSGNATTGEYIYTIPQSIFTLYPTYTELREDMNIYNNYCNNYVTTQQACINAFSGSKAINITLLNKLNGKNSTRLNTLYDYCKTREVYSGSLDTNTCDLTDEEIKNIVPSMLTPEGQAENAMQQGITTTKPGEGTVYDGLTDNNQRDIITAIPRVIEKIETMFFNNSGVQGIIPDYITRIILLTVLFLIFKH